MKKILIGILLGTFCLLFGWSSASAGPSIDQQHTEGGASVSINGSLGRFAQTFKPTYTRLDRVELELVNVTGSKKLTVSIRHRSGLIWDEGSVATVSNQTIHDGWNTFDFEDIAVGITENDSYGIYVSCPDSSQWKYKGGPSVYDRGFAIWQSQDKFDWDYNFKTWGYDPTEIIEEQDISEQQNSTPDDGTTATTTTAAATTGETPAVTTSSSIEKATELKAAYADAEGVKLTWKASKTADIDGYVLFRSETKGKNYAKVGSTDKKTVEYVDKTAQATKTYYYIVRAYKGSAQSANSNEASASVPADAAPVAPSNLKVDSYSDSLIKVSWFKNPEANISGYTAIIYKGDQEIATKEIPADTLTSSFAGLSADTEYKITVVAKNSLAKVSSPSEVVQKTSVSEIPAKVGIFDGGIVAWILLAAAIVLTVVLVILFYRRHKKQKLNDRKI